MSHKFSFLQAFAGYYSSRCKLLSSCRVKYWFKSLRADLRVEYYRLFQKMIVVANTGQSRTYICQVASLFDISSYFTVSASTTPASKCYGQVVDRFIDVTNQYNILHLKKFLPQSWLDWEFFQCKDLLHYIDLANINWFQSTLGNIYPSFTFSQNNN